MNNLCILEAGFINPALENKYPTYTKVFSEFLITNSRKWKVSSFKIYKNEFPKNIQEYNSFIITGSSFGVYENHNWIIQALKLINKIISYKKQLVGICFGHQLIIQAINGLVEKNSGGWSTGIKSVKFNIQKPWFPKFDEQIRLISFHQDQVVKIPNFVEHLAETNFCKYYALSIEDYIFTIQGHPEFSNIYALDLLEIKRKSIGEKQYFESKKTLEKQNHHGYLFSKIIANFLEKKF